jgi:hypothetical protein
VGSLLKHILLFNQLRYLKKCNKKQLNKLTKEESIPQDLDQGLQDLQTPQLVACWEDQTQGVEVLEQEKV